MQILQFPDNSWGLTVLKDIFLRFIGLKGLEMVWKKSSLIWNFSPWFWLKNPCFSLISLTGKSLQNFPWIPWFPWSVGTLKFYSPNCSQLRACYPIPWLRKWDEQFWCHSPVANLMGFSIDFQFHASFCSSIMQSVTNWFQGKKLPMPH